MTDRETDARLVARAERRILAALRQLHRRSPHRADHRVDAVVARVRETDAARPASHRGGAGLALDERELHAVVDGLVERGILVRHGHRIGLADAPAPGAQEARRVEALLDELRRHGASVPRVDAVARRHGVGPHVVEGLRAAGRLVSVGPGIDYPHDVWQALDARIRALPERSVVTVRDELGCSRRHAAALLGASRLRR